MAVARSYEKYKIEGEPFKESGRWYVNVITPKGLKKVRWYSDAERAAQDKKAGAKSDVNDIMDFNARHAFGFDEAGYITIFKGDEEVIRDWAQSVWPPRAWYNLTFGFHTPSKMEVTDLPDSIEPIRLTWEEVQDHDDRMKPHDVVHKYVMSLLKDNYGAESVFQGEVDTWIERDLAVFSKNTSTNHYGEKHTYVLIDANQNFYQWATNTKNYEVGTFVKLKMKVKSHSVIDEVNTTVVWYCKEK